LIRALGEDFVGGLDDGVADFGSEKAEVSVGLGGRLFDEDKGVDEAVVLSEAGDLKEVFAALGLGPPVSVGGDLNFTKGVFLDAGGHWDEVTFPQSLGPSVPYSLYNSPMDLKARVDELASLMSEFGLSEGELKGEGWRVALKKLPANGGAHQENAHQVTDIHGEIFEVPRFDPPKEEPKPNGTPVSSPMTGIYYTASSPTAPPFVKVGDAVEAGQVVGLIEAMKVFNEIVAPMSGTVTEISAENGQLVQPGEPLLFIA
jgi:acetyl-CoA carboxylase biotin carboxyl carrier protein